MNLRDRLRAAVRYVVAKVEAIDERRYNIDIVIVSCVLLIATWAIVTTRYGR